MKRLVSGVLAVLLFLVLHPVAYADSTKRHGALEFCELYTSRLPAAYESAEIDEDIRISRDMVFGQSNDNVITVSFDGGILDVDLEDFTVAALDTTLYDFRRFEDENTPVYVRCITAFSALEYDDVEDQLFKWYAKAGIGSGANNAVEESFRIWNEIIVPAFDPAITEAVQSGEEVLLYSGNYDYYIVYYSLQGIETPYEQLSLTARARR